MISLRVPARASRSLPGSILLLSCCLSAVGTPSVRAEDLQTDYQKAVASSPHIARAQAELDAALAGKPLARSALLPHLDAFASGGENTARVTGFGPQTLSTGYHSDVFSATLTQSIFDGQARVAVAQSDSRIQAGRAALASAEQDLAVAVVQAYFSVLRTQADQRVAQNQSDLLASIDKEAKARLDAGMGDIIAVREAQAQLDAAQADVIAATNAIEVAKSQLQELTHQPVGALRDVSDLKPAGPEPPSAAPWIASALKNQPLLRQKQAELKAAEQQAEFERRAWWPTLSFTGAGQHSAGALIPPVAMDQIGGSLNLSIPIYEGGRIRSRTRQAAALSRATRAGVAETEDQIRVETQIAFVDLQTSVARYQAARAAVDSAQIALDATRKGYEIGSRSMIDLLTAASQLAAVQRTFSLALYTQLVARAQLKAAAGVLSAQDIESINTLLTGPERP